MVTNLVGRRVRAGSGAGWQLAAAHIETVWNATYAALKRGGTVGDPLAFGAVVARHVASCGRCQTPEAEEVWAVAFNKMDVWGFVAPIMRERREHG